MSSQEDSQPSQDSVMTLVQEERHEVLYFAYGSNLSTEQMRQRCPYSTPVGLAYLEGWRWFINDCGYANITRVEDEAEGKGKGKEKEYQQQQQEKGVYGLLYLLPPQDEELLDGYEGVPDVYQKYQVDVKWASEDQGSETLRALVYVDGTAIQNGPPLTEYIGRMERAIGDVVDNWGLDEGYANRVMRRFWK